MSVGSGRVKAVSGRLPEQFTVRPPRARVRPELRTSPAGCDVVAAPTRQGSHHGVAARFRMNVVIRRRFVLTQSAAAGPEPASRTLTPSQPNHRSAGREQVVRPGATFVARRSNRKATEAAHLQRLPEAPLTDSNR